MPQLTTLARLRELKRALETAVRVTKELAVNQTLTRLAARDPERWNFLLDSLAAGKEARGPGPLSPGLAALPPAPGGGAGGTRGAVGPLPPPRATAAHPAAPRRRAP